MAGSGPAPKFPEQRRNRNEKQRGEWVDIPAHGVDVPPMPDGAWSARSIAAWSSWWSDPAATQWTESQFDEVVVLLALTEEFWQGNYTRANEMRLRSDGLGLTQKGKRDLRWRIGEGEAPPKPKPAAKRRSRLKVVS